MNENLKIFILRIYNTITGYLWSKMVGKIKVENSKKTLDKSAYI